MIRVLRFVLPLIAIFAIAGLGFRILSANKPEPEVSNEERAPLAAFAEKIDRRTLRYTVTTQGEVRPRSEITVTPQVAGRVVFVSNNFVDGGFIAKGQAIARLDTADFELAVVRAKAGVAGAQQGLAREQAEADLAVKDLQELGIESSSPLARREPQLAEAQAALDSAYAQLSEATLALERTTIRAPFDVRVRQRSTDVGQFVSPGQDLGSIFAVDSVEVALPLTDEQMGQLGLPLAFSATRANPGPEVIFSTTVGGEIRYWTGSITRTAAAVNSQSRLINVFGEVKDPYGAGADNGAPMAPGLFVTAELSGKTVENTLWAPRSAVRGNNQLYIGDQESGTLSIRTIDVLHTDANGAYFVNGAEVGELAVTSPVQAPFDGMRLGIRERLSDGTILEPVKESNAHDILATSGALETSQ